VGLLEPIRDYIDTLVHPSARDDAFARARHRAFMAPRLLGSLGLLAAFPIYLVMRGAPSALELLRARNAIPPGTEGLPGSSLPALSRSSQFEGDVAIRALRQRLALAPDFVAPPPVSRRSRSLMPSLGRFSLVLLVV